MKLQTFFENNILPSLELKIKRKEITLEKAITEIRWWYKEDLAFNDAENTVKEKLE